MQIWTLSQLPLHAVFVQLARQMAEILKSRIVPLGILLIAFAFLGLFQTCFSDPTTIHFTRQTDSLSFAAQYHNQGYHFFQPALFDLSSTDGKAACEFPLFYYLTALLYGVVGPHTFLLKWLHLVVIGFGLLKMYSGIRSYLKDDILSGLSVLLLFTSTVFGYYAFNYLPDAPALGFTLAGWGFWLEAICTGKQKKIRWAFVLFALAGLLKATYLIHPITAVLVILLDRWGWKNWKPEYLRTSLLYFGGGVLLVLCWNLWMAGYNEANQSVYFATTPRPIWNYSAAENRDVWNHITGLWYAGYLAHSSYHLLALMVLVPLIFVRRMSGWMGALTVILLIGCAAYVLLFFEKFRYHDYYMLALAPLVLLITAHGLRVLQESATRKWMTWVVRAGLAAVVFTGMNYARIKLADRFNQEPDRTSLMGSELLRIHAEGTWPDLPESARVLVIGDASVNGSLLAVNRQGWQVASDDDLDPDRLRAYLELGVTHIIVSTAYSANPALLSLNPRRLHSSEKLVLFAFQKVP